MRRWVKVVLWAIAALAVAFVAIQFVPYGRDHTNPPVTAEPSWDSAQTKALAKKACFDCHSNETVWPFYSKIAPASWLVYHDVQEGRDGLNLSEWPSLPAGGGQAIADRAAELIGSGEMPPMQYRLAHSGARLSDGEKQQLIAGLKASLK
jgi:mono/diheme cytochrome c family protein